MPDPVYNYVPIWGVEDYEENPGSSSGGGAKVTNDNLIITQWEVSSKTGTPPDIVSFGDILVPVDNKDSIPEDLRPGVGQAMHGRVGARFGFDPIDDKKVASLILATCNPPQELKQQLANSVVFNGGDPDDDANYTTKKSVQGVFSFSQAPTTASPGGSQNFAAVAAGFPMVCSYYIPALFLSWTAGPGPSAIPLLRTSGADGNTPTFFDMATEAGVNECIAAVNKGDFYVALITATGIGAGAYQQNTLWWPHSVGRS